MSMLDAVEENMEIIKGAVEFLEKLTTNSELDRVIRRWRRLRREPNLKLLLSLCPLIWRRPMQFGEALRNGGMHTSGRAHFLCALTRMK